MRRLRSQRGQVVAGIFFVLLMMAIALVLGRRYFEGDVILDQREVTQARMKKVSDALVAFVVLNKRLPCPASGTSDAGTEDAASPYANCISPKGVVPWAALAIKRDDALDGWGRKISYRVYTDVINGLTREPDPPPNPLPPPPPYPYPYPGGMNMTNCNSSLGAEIQPLDVNYFYQCKPDIPPSTPPPNTPEAFFLVRGDMLVVQDSGTARKGNAFVLISHGDTGFGAFGAAGVPNTPPDAGGNEFTNTQAGGTFWVVPRKSLPDTLPSASDHFDDVLAYMSAAELATRARLAARSWVDKYPSLGTPFDAPAVGAAAPGFDHTSSEDTLRTSLSIGGYLVRATSAGGAAVNIGFLTTNSIGGIGVVGGGSTSGDLSSFYGERLTFQLGAGSEFHKTSLALSGFQIRTVPLAVPPTFLEIAEVSFWRGGDLQQASVVESWDDQNQPTRCLFEMVAGAVFDRIDVRPLSRLPDGLSSRFTVAAIKSCAEATGSCTVDVPDATANLIPIADCPTRPPSAASGAAASVAQTTATLQGFAQDNGASTAASFDYGLTCAYASNVAATPGTIGAGAGKSAVSAPITGLACNTSYYFRTRATSAGGAALGNDAMLKTAACAFPTPIATSANPASITTTTATLNGVANDNGGITTVTFEYGLTSCYGSSIAATPGTFAIGTGAQAVTASLTGLSCNTRYHYRIRAQSAAGTDTGKDIAFTTAPCP